MGITQFKGSQATFNLASNFTGSLIPSLIGTGTTTPTAFNFLRGDGTWANSPDKPPSQFKQFAWLHDAGTNTLASWNSSLGPGTFGTLQGRYNDNTGEYLSYTSSASIGGSAGWNSAFNLFQTQWKLIATMIIRTNNTADITNTRLTVGLGSGDISASDNPALHLMGFRYSTSSDGTAFWRTYTKDGTTLNVQVTTVPITIFTRYVLKIDASNPASIKFYINGVLTNTHTTNLPSPTQALGLTMLNTTLTTASLYLMVNRFHLEYGV